MAHDITSQFYTSLNLPLHEKLAELTRIIDHSGPNKELQALFPQLVNSIFANSFTNGWGLRMITLDANKYEFEALTSFLEPQGPMFRLCYKLLSDPQLKYNLPLNTLPLNLQMSLERGRCSQFYSDMLTMDAQSMNVVALALNPFDYYIFSFALFLINNSQNKSSWENWNSVYFALACDYLMHFLPTDPNEPVLPHIPNYTGKVPTVAPLQTANRPLSSPSLLLIQDLSGMSNQHSQHVSQTQSRNEVWRSETVLQVFIDVWMSVEEFNSRGVDMYQRSYPIMSSPERVRIVRVLVKHIHSFSAKHLSDPASRSCALRKYARQLMCARAYRYVQHLVTSWPLDASFRLVMELWLSLIQPWRYTDNMINRDRFRTTNNNQEEGNSNILDASYTQFIAENFPSYTCIFQLVLPRFLRLDLTAYKNTVMLFRLGKVFSQPHLVPILWNLEQAMTDFNSSLLQSPDSSYNNSIHDQSYIYNGIPLHKWVAIAKQAVSELNLSANFEYDPIWSDNKKKSAMDFIKRILAAKIASDRNLEDMNRKINENHQGFWASIKHWLMIDNQFETDLVLEETKKVPVYLNASVHHFATIFLINETSLMAPEPIVEDSALEHSSFGNSSSFPLYITNKLRSKPTEVKYMGDPDLMPITSYESTILVRMLYQIASRINEIYREEFISLWQSNNFWGHVAREVLHPPCTIQTYVRDLTNHQNIVVEELAPRLVLRRLGSHAFVAWAAIGYLLFRLLSFSGFTYTFILFLLWVMFVFTKVSLKMLKILK
ncbi:sphingomyelin phosphodiesterase 4 [Plodia interpunctella]|uniref:sphingomyelin phosphodiesterase 4 n=1 Tax=Plodia interpunctella TaxID=58824 RepID=UPI0023679768|nr:sphingomyelin phosphodiesterase 4 [Plodia interpunctella]